MCSAMRHPSRFICQFYCALRPSVHGAESYPVGSKRKFAALRLNGRFGRRSQLIDARHALKRSAGVSYPSVFRGRSLSCLATALSFAWQCIDKSAPFGKYCRSSRWCFRLRRVATHCPAGDCLSNLPGRGCKVRTGRHRYPSPS